MPGTTSSGTLPRWLEFILANGVTVGLLFWRVDAGDLTWREALVYGPILLLIVNGVAWLLTRRRGTAAGSVDSDR